MKVALYYPWLYLKSGVERTILETVKRSKHEYTIFTNHYDPQSTYPEYKKLNVIELKRVPVARNIKSVLKAALIIAGQKIDLNGFDLLMVHSDGLGDLITIRNSNYSFQSLVFGRRMPVLNYCHTPLRPVFDEIYRKHALKARPYKVHLIFRVFSLLFKILDRLLWKRYSFIYFNSHESRRRAEKGGLLNGIHGLNEVLYPGVDAENILPSMVYKLYFFLPGRIMWTKNIELAINSFIRLKEQSSKDKEFKLIIAGQVDHKSKDYLNYLKNISQKRTDIKFIIDPTDSEMKKLYTKCWAVLSASFNEDFGLTILEGFAYGKPAIALERGGPKESVKNYQTGILVKEDLDKFSNALFKLASNKRLTIKMGKAARSISLNYSWDIFIKRLDNRMTQLVKNI